MGCAGVCVLGKGGTWGIYKKKIERKARAPHKWYHIVSEGSAEGGWDSSRKFRHWLKVPFSLTPVLTKIKMEHMTEKGVNQGSKC